MSYISQIFERANLQQIREFLVNGGECTEINPKNYRDRIEGTRKPAIDFALSRFPNKKECEEITALIYDYATACQDVYMEIGLQCGFQLAAQMMDKGRGNTNEHTGRTILWQH